MSEAKRRQEPAEVDQTLTEFAKRVIEGEGTADLFGVDENFIHAVLHKAHQFYSNNSHGKAETLLRGATVLDNQQPYAHLLLGEVLLQGARLEEAMPVLERAHALDPDNPHGMAKLGEVFVRMGQKTEDAVALLEHAIAGFEEGTPHHKRACALLTIARQLDDAEAGND